MRGAATLALTLTMPGELAEGTGRPIPLPAARGRAARRASR